MYHVNRCGYVMLIVAFFSEVCAKFDVMPFSLRYMHAHYVIIFMT